MFKELKNAYKIIQYGLSVKKQLGFAIMFAAIGIALELVTKGTQPVGAFYIVLSGLFIYQMIISSGVSTLIQSSPYKKKIQCTYPLLAVIPWTYITFTIIVIIHGIFAKGTDPETGSQYGANILLIGFLLFITMAYFGICYKYFILSTVLMCFSITFPMTAINIISHKHIALFSNYAACAAIAYVLLTLGSILSWVLTRLLYKKDLSRLAFRGVLGKNS